MRLISKFKDYYDSPLRQFSSDPKYTFVRETSEIQIKNFPFYGLNYNVGDKSFCFNSGIVGFCGSLFPFLKKTDLVFDSVDESSKCISSYFYTLHDFERNYPHIFKGTAQGVKWVHNNDSSVKSLKRWFDGGTVTGYLYSHCCKDDSAITTIFSKHQVAYFVIEEASRSYNEEVTVTLYPNLRHFSFFKVFDVVTAAQKIEMYLLNELIKPDEIRIVIPDKMKIHSHGFDKWSFRKMSEKGKK